MSRFALSSLAVISALGLVAAAGASLAGFTSQSRAGAPSMDGESVVHTHTLTLEGANRVLAAAIAMAKDRAAGGAIAVVDEGGNLIALQRLDGTFPAGSDVSIGKARTAALFKKPTKSFEDAINGGRIALAAVREMTPLQGGVPIVHEARIVGAIGVSGAHSQVEDEEIAMAGAAAIDSSTPSASK